MTCVSPEGRITPGCTGFYAPEHEVAWKRLVDFVHAETEAKICAQIGHSGAKGSTQLGWQQIDAPLNSGNWPLMAASEVAWSPANQVPKAMDRADMAQMHGAVRGLGGDGGALRLRHARDPCRARLSAVVLHHADHQPSHRRNTAARWRTGCAIRWKSSRPCARSGRRTSRSPCASRPTTGWATRA